MEVKSNFEGFYNDAMAEKSEKQEVCDEKLDIVEGKIIEFSARMAETHAKIQPNEDLIDDK